MEDQGVEVMETRRRWTIKRWIAVSILFGMANAFVPVILTVFLSDPSQVAWRVAVPPILLIAVSSTFLSLFIGASTTSSANGFSERILRLKP